MTTSDVNRPALQLRRLCLRQGADRLPAFFRKDIRQAPGHFRQHLRRIVSLPSQDVQVEPGEFRHVEVKAGSSVRPFVLQVRTDPVDYRHEVVANGPDAASSQIREALDIIVNECVPLRPSVFNGFRNGKAFHHAPSETCCLDETLQVLNRVYAPNLTARHIVKGSNNALHPDLPEHLQRNPVIPSEPSPTFFHINC